MVKKLPNFLQDDDLSQPTYHLTCDTYFSVKTVLLPVRNAKYRSQQLQDEQTKYLELRNDSVFKQFYS